MARLTTVLDQLPICTRTYRRSMGLSVEGAAGEIGVPPSVLHGFENGTDSRVQTVKRVVAWLETRQSAQTGRPVEIVVDPASRIADLEAQVAGLTERILRLFRDRGPYRVGHWTKDVNHVDLCDCDPDGEWVGDHCMENSQWVYGVFMEESDRLEVLLTLPRIPPVPDGHGPMATVEELVGDELHLEVETLRDQLAAAVDVINAREDRSPVGAAMIMAERRRQIVDKGYDSAHDRHHTPAQLIDAAMAYIYAALQQRDSARMYWPWRIEHFKPKDQVSNLTRAGALIAAAIDRVEG